MRHDMPVDRPSRYEVYALLWLTNSSEQRMKDLLCGECGVPESAIERGMHLTIYHARRSLPGLLTGSRRISIKSDLAETRFMVLAPGGENARPELEPCLRSVGIRLTKRNKAIPEILMLRRELYRLESEEVVKGRDRTSDWVNAFGARQFQPHIKLIRPKSGIARDLTIMGAKFRDGGGDLEFGRLEIKDGIRKQAY